MMVEVLKPTSRMTKADNRPVDGKTAHVRSDVVLNTGDALGAPIERADELLPADLIHDDEVVILLLRPHPFYILLSSLAGLAVIAILTMILAYTANTISWVTWNDSQAFALGGILAMARLCWQTLEWYSRVYVLTDKRLIRKMGVLRIAIFETPLSKIQHTSVFQSVRERLCLLGTIGFATAGSDVYEAFWVMLAKPFAVHKIVVETMNRYGRKR